MTLPDNPAHKRPAVNHLSANPLAQGAKAVPDSTVAALALAASGLLNLALAASGLQERAAALVQAVLATE